jgi:hypothetical protein
VNAREIAGIAFGRARKGFLVSLRVYFDGSGKENDHPVITVGGFMADPTICESIERDWEEATEGKVFHLADFGNPNCKLGSRNWNAERRVAFLKRLAAIVNRPGNYIMSVSVEVAAVNKILAEAKFPNEIGPVYSACAYAAILNTEGYLLKENRLEQEVQYIFEKGDREHEIAITFADFDEKTSKLRGLRGHSFLPKQTTLLQPADLIAGVVQRCVIAQHAAFPSLDNGIARTQLNSFERHYSADGVTAAVVSGHDRKHCWIANAQSFKFLDGVATRFFEKRPEQLKKRLKRATYRPKRTTK